MRQMYTHLSREKPPDKLVSVQTIFLQTLATKVRVSDRENIFEKRIDRKRSGFAMHKNRLSKPWFLKPQTR